MPGFVLPFFQFLSSPTTRHLIWRSTATEGFGRRRSMEVSKPREVNGAYLYDEITGESVAFQNMPTEFTDQKSADWSDTVIPGRSEPIKGYSASSARVFSLSVTFVESMDQGDAPWSAAGVQVGNSGSSGETPPFPEPFYVRKKVNFLRSLVYPDYSQGSNMVHPPHPIIFVIGKLIRSRCVMKDVQITWRGPWDPVTLIPLQAEVSFTLEEVNALPWGVTEVRSGSDLYAAPGTDVNSFTFYI